LQHPVTTPSSNEQPQQKTIPISNVNYRLDEENAIRYMVVNGNASTKLIEKKKQPKSLLSELKQQAAQEEQVKLAAVQVTPLAEQENEAQQQQQQLVLTMNSFQTERTPSITSSSTTSTMWITKPLLGTCFFELKFKFKVTMTATNFNGDSSSSFVSSLEEERLHTKYHMHLLDSHLTRHLRQPTRSFVNLILQDQSPYVSASNSSSNANSNSNDDYLEMLERSKNNSNTSKTQFGLDSKQVALEIALLSSGLTKLHSLQCMNQQIKNVKDAADVKEVNGKRTYNNTLIEPALLKHEREARMVEATILLVPSPFENRPSCFCLAVLTNELDEDLAEAVKVDHGGEPKFKNTNVAFIEPLNAATLAHKLKNFNHYFGVHVSKCVASVEFEQFTLETFTQESDQCQKAMKRVKDEGRVLCTSCGFDMTNPKQNDKFFVYSSAKCKMHVYPSV